MSADDRLLVEYLRRAYHAVDGLWFVKVEESHGIDEALELDRRVWEVLAKIQARKARELTGSPDNSRAALERCFGLKLAADGHAYELARAPESVSFRIAGCPWLELLRKSGRTHLALRVAEAICLTEGRVWCAEFGGEWQFDMPQMACAGGEACVMRFAGKPRGDAEHEARA